MTPHEELLIIRSINAYKQSIKFMKEQIHQLELRRLKVYKDCPECKKFKIAEK
tara:strand:+ start:71 stop:229 length:159 start_codon:yes stop_codon:yes gene_type:complete